MSGGGTEDNAVEERICRICLGGEEEEEQEENNNGESSSYFTTNINHVERLISPCLCSGSMKYVHPSCLQSWRAAANKTESTIRCDQCQYEYHINRTTIALFLMSENGPITVAAIVIVGLIHLLGLIMYFLLTTNGFREGLYNWLQLESRTDGEGLGQFLTENPYGEILTLGAASLGFINFLHHVMTTFWVSYIHYREHGGMRFDMHQGVIFMAIWIYMETVEAQRGRGLAVVGLFVALYNSYRVSIKHARDTAQWLGETILEPNLSQAAPVVEQQQQPRQQQQQQQRQDNDSSSNNDEPPNHQEEGERPEPGQEQE